MELTWRTEKRKVKDLKLFEDNPRRMTRRRAQQLLDSLQKFNLVEIPAIDTNNRVIAGNMRIKALRKLKRDEEEIDVRVPSRPLTEEEAKEYLLRSNKNVGDWDEILLMNFPKDLLHTIGWQLGYLNKLFKLKQTIYSTKVAVPIYEPRGLKVDVKDLYDDRRCLELLAVVEKIDCDKQLKEFLRYAAYRFVSFNFKNIAEYYSNLKDEKLKEIFQKLALVVIDFNQAIENGFVELTKELFDFIEEEVEDIEEFGG